MPDLAPQPTQKVSGLLSIVLLSYQSEDRLRPAVNEVVHSMEAERIPFELIIMDDGSTDRSFELARRLARNDDRIRAFQLSRNFSSP